MMSDAPTNAGKQIMSNNSSVTCVASDSQKIQFSDWPKQRCALRRYIISCFLSEHLTLVQAFCRYSNYHDSCLPYNAFRDEFANLPLGDDGVAEVKASVLPLDGTVEVEHVTQPVVGGAAGLELLRAQRVRDVLYRVTQAVGEVVCRVHAPGNE